MKLTKICHSTLLFEYKERKILFDPGDYTIEEVKNLHDLDLLIITHNHPDHLHLESVKLLKENNPQIQIITNSEVAVILHKELEIESTICDKNNTFNFADIEIQSYEFPHIDIWKDIPLPQHTAYLLDDVLYNAADAFGVINTKPKICTFMITGPAVRASDALEFGLNQQMELGIGIHDGMLNRVMANHTLPEKFLNIESKSYKNLSAGESIDLP